MRSARSFNLSLRTAFEDAGREIPAQVTLRHDGSKPEILVEAGQSTIVIPLATLARVAFLQPKLLSGDPKLQA